MFQGAEADFGGSGLGQKTFAGQADVVTIEWRHVVQEIVGNGFAGGHVVLVFERAIDDQASLWMYTAGARARAILGQWPV